MAKITKTRRRLSGAKQNRKKPQFSRASDPRPFRPTAAMVRFLFTELELLGKRRPYTQKQVAEAAKVSEFQASRWHDVPGYDDWHADQLHGAAIRLFNRGKVAVGCQVLMTGDPKELETFGRILGVVPTGTADASEGSGASSGIVYNFLIPRPATPVVPGVTVREYDAQGQELPADIPTIAVR